MKQFIVTPKDANDFKVIRNFFSRFDVPFKEIKNIQTKENIEDIEDAVESKKILKRIQSGKEKTHRLSDVIKELKLS